jgi:pyridoxamine 5'-phosphate oxidase
MTTDFDNPQDFPSILNQAWQLLRRGVADRRHGFHTAVVANVETDGRPRSRVVILRKADAEAKVLRYHTDIRSAKWQGLTKQPAVSVLFYDAGDRVQLRVDGEAKLHHDDDVAKAAWGSSKQMSKVCYGSAPAPGSEIASFADFSLPIADDVGAIESGYVNFGAVVIHIQTIEWLSLKVRGNRRAVFDLRTNQAKWLVP